MELWHFQILQMGVFGTLQTDTLHALTSNADNFNNFNRLFSQCRRCLFSLRQTFDDGNANLYSVRLKQW